MASIFVVEDEEEIIELIRVALQPLGHDLKAISDGTQALSILKKQTFDLIVLDIMIPGMDGYSLLLELEKSPNATKPCIVMTALRPAEKLFERFSNVKYFMAKPFAPEDIREKVQSALNQ
ncbi:MAG: response regulator [Elusimicrobia bacterium]|nr:response regulator [Elusimicrobiota bacterium]MBD3411629.1 response regulator [Elusimicrobiota bacterium]